MSAETALREALETLHTFTMQGGLVEPRGSEYAFIHSPACDERCWVIRALASPESRSLDDHSDPRYRPLMLAVRDADEAFQKAGDAGTKTWLDDYFLPELEAHGLTVARLREHPEGDPR